MLIKPQHMRNLLLALLVFTCTSVKGQVEFLDFDKYADCRVDVPITNSNLNRAKTHEIAKQFEGKELVVIDANKKGKIKSSYRGFIRINESKDGPPTLFEPTESVVSLEKSWVVFLIYKDGRTYCYDAVCYDEKNGIESSLDELVCEPENDTAMIYYNNGTLAMGIEQYANAQQWFQASLAKDSTFCDAWNSLGVAHQRMGNFKKAYWSYINAVYNDTTNYMSWLNLHDLFLASGDTAEAVKSLENLIRFVPDNELGYSALRDWYQTLGEAEKEKELLIKAQANGVILKEEEIDNNGGEE